MQDSVDSALATLQAAKQKGLSYYEAVQGLDAQGFSQEVIDDASDRFDYAQGIIRSPETASKSPEGQAEKQELDDELQNADAQLRKDQIDESLENFHFGRF